MLNAVSNPSQGSSTTIKIIQKVQYGGAALSLFISCLFLTFARGTCLGASLVCIAVYAIAEDSSISDETGPVAEGSEIVMCVLCVNVFIFVEELWEGFETAFSTYLV